MSNLGMVSFFLKFYVVNLVLGTLLCPNVFAADGVLIRFPVERITRSSSVSTEAGTLACVRVLTQLTDLDIRVEDVANQLEQLYNSGAFARYNELLVKNLDWVESVRAQNLAAIPFYIPLFLDQFSKNRLLKGHGLSDAHILRLHMLMIEFAQEHPTTVESEQILLLGMAEFVSDPSLEGIGRVHQWRENWLNAWKRYNEELANARNADMVFDEARHTVTSKKFKSAFHRVGRLLSSPNVSKKRKIGLYRWLKEVGALVATLN